MHKAEAAKEAAFLEPRPPAAFRHGKFKKELHKPATRVPKKLN